MSKYVYSSSPHVKSPRTTKQIMIDVCIALLPACIAGCVLLGLAEARLGWLSLMVLALASLSAVASEFIFCFAAKRNLPKFLNSSIFSSLVTGLLCRYEYVRYFQVVRSYSCQCVRRYNRKNVIRRYW